ncbi:MAG: hypothetical protein KKD90_02210 [Candidatus Omnitrophica bacterium]|nr:hypothetical protein [Candidatus Omnitrophota bacterium]
MLIGAMVYSDIAYSFNLRPALRSNYLSEEVIQKLAWSVKEFKPENVKVKNGTKFGALIKPEDLQWEGVKVKYVLNTGVYQDEVDFPGKIFLFPRIVEDMTVDAKGERYVSHIGFAVLEKTHNGYKLSILNRAVLSPSFKTKNDIKIYKDGIVAYEDARIKAIGDNIVLQCTEAEEMTHHLAFYSIKKDDFEGFLANPIDPVRKFKRMSSIPDLTKNGNIIQLDDGRFFTYANSYDDENFDGDIVGFTADSLEGPWKDPLPINDLKKIKNIEGTKNRLSPGSPFMTIRIKGEDYLFSIFNESYIKEEKKFYRPVAIIADANDPAMIIWRGTETLFEPDKVSDEEKWKLRQIDYDVVYVCGAARSEKDKILVFYGDHDYSVRFMELNLSEVIPARFYNKTTLDELFARNWDQRIGL